MDVSTNLEERKSHKSNASSKVPSDSVKELDILPKKSAKNPRININRTNSNEIYST
jgi:hypothetical protein